MRLEDMRVLWRDMTPQQKYKAITHNRRLRRTPVERQEVNPYENVFTRDRSEVTVCRGFYTGEST